MAGIETRETVESGGLTTTKSPFIEQEVQAGRLYIHQPYELYSEANHEAWRGLYSRMLSRCCVREAN